MPRQRTTPSRELDPVQRKRLLMRLFELSQGGTLPHGSKTIAASEYKCSTKTVTRLWARRNDETQTNRKGQCGRKRRFTVEEVNERLVNVPLAQRQTLRDSSEGTGIPKTNLFRYLKSGDMKRSTTTLKP